MKVNPCNDSLYLSIHAKPLDKMTQQEMEYFIINAKKCADFKRDSSKILQHDAKDTVEGKADNPKIFNGKK